MKKKERKGKDKNTTTCNNFCNKIKMDNTEELILVLQFSDYHITVFISWRHLYSTDMKAENKCLVLLLFLSILHKPWNNIFDLWKLSSWRFRVHSCHGSMSICFFAHKIILVWYFVLIFSVNFVSLFFLQIFWGKHKKWLIPVIVTVSVLFLFIAAYWVEKHAPK